MREARQHERHRPEATALHSIVRDNLETFLAPCSEPRPACAPAAVATPRAALLALRAPLPYIPWAELLRRTYDLDALRCPCDCRLRFIAVILEAKVA